MTHESRSAAERQLAMRLQQAASNQAYREPPLSWPLTQTASRGWWWSVISLASAAAVGWFLFAGTTLWQPNPKVNSAPKPPMLIAENYQLQAIDQRIQQAYLAGADEQTITELWQQRQYWTAKDHLNQEWTQ